MRADPVAAATAFVDGRFPTAKVAILGGSSTTRRRTEFSDLDVVVVDGSLPVPYRETTRAEGWLVEAFVHNDVSLAHYWRLDVDSRRPALIRMCADGRVIRGADGPGADVQRAARLILEAGPPPLPDDQRAYRRYTLTDLLDDFLGCDDGVEQPFIVNSLVTAAAELALLSANAWLGSGKWLARELAEAHPELAARFPSAVSAALWTDEKRPLRQLVDDILQLAGGRLAEGYRSQGTLPDEAGS